MEKTVAVGTALAGGPPHGSVLEELPHTALSSGRTRPLPKTAGRGPPVEATRLVRHCVRGVVNRKDRPLARSPSLSGLRRRLRADFVRPLRRYYEIVRLPGNVHARRAALWPSPAVPRQERQGSSWGLPVLAHGASTHAQGLRAYPNNR